MSGEKNARAGRPRAVGRERFRGQLLIELMIAMSVLIVGFGGLFALVHRSLAVSRLISEKYIATYLATEGIEVAKNILDANRITPGAAWNGGFADGDYEVEYDSTELVPASGRTLTFGEVSGIEVYHYGGGKDTPFQRKIAVDLVGGNELRLRSEVNWKSKGSDFSVALEDRFYNVGF